MSTTPTPEVLFDVVADMHAPELYQPQATAEGVDRLEDIGPEQISFYHQHGYITVRSAFTPQEVADATAGLVDLIMGKRPDFKHVYFEGKAKAILPTLGPEQRQDAVRKIGNFIEFDARLKALSHHPALLRAIQSLMEGKAPELFQDMALIKPPLLGREKPWHQDKAYFEYPLGTPVVGVWIALDEATIANGCMQILPRTHQGKVVTHHTGGNAGFLVIRDEDLPGDPRQAVWAPCPRGGVVFMSNRTPHCSTPNYSDHIRWSIDLRFQSVDAPSNVGLWPRTLDDDGNADAEFYKKGTVACYPPEADFLVNSAKTPHLVTNYGEYARRRETYDRTKPIFPPVRRWPALAEAGTAKATKGRRKSAK